MPSSWRSISICRWRGSTSSRAIADRIATGGGTGGSRSIPVGGASVARASETLAERLKTLASDELEAGIADLEIVGGSCARRRHRQVDRLCRASPGCPRRRRSCSPPATPISRARRPIRMAPISARSRSIPTPASRTIVAYTIVDDFGVVVNPHAARGPGSWRHRAGHRPGAAGAHRLFATTAS